MSLRRQFHLRLKQFKETLSGTDALNRSLITKKYKILQDSATFRSLISSNIINTYVRNKFYDF